MKHGLTNNDGNQMGNAVDTSMTDLVMLFKALAAHQDSATWGLAVAPAAQPVFVNRDR